MNTYVETVEKQNEELQKKLANLQKETNGIVPFWLYYRDSAGKEITRMDYGTMFYNIATVRLTNKKWVVGLTSLNFPSVAQLYPSNSGFDTMEEAKDHVIRQVASLIKKQEMEIEVHQGKI